MSTYFADQDSTNDLPYNFGPSNSWNVNSTYLSPYDWLYGAYAPAFWQENFDDLALSEVRRIQQGDHTRPSKAKLVFNVGVVFLFVEIACAADTR